MEQSTLTIDLPKTVRLRMESLALALCITNVRGGKEVPNRSSAARILLEIGLVHADSFRQWLREYTPDPNQELYRFTFQAPDPFVEKLESLAVVTKLTRAEENKRVPNLTQVIRRLLEFTLSRPDLIWHWFGERIKSTIAELESY